MGIWVNVRNQSQQNKEERIDFTPPRQENRALGIAVEYARNGAKRKAGFVW